MIYLALNKPAGYTTTRSDKHAAKTVYDLLPKDLKRKVWPVGRLDKDSKGLLILTNDGDLTQKLTHPSFEHEKEYIVKFTGDLSDDKLDKLRKGFIINNQKMKMHYVNTIKPNVLKIVLREGKKRQIRVMLENQGCQIFQLTRTRISKLKLDQLRSGEYKNISIKEII